MATKRKRPKKITHEKIAAAHGLSTKTIGRYKEDGVDVTDPLDVERHRRAQQHTGRGAKLPPATEDVEMTYDAQRTLKLAKQNRALDFEYEVQLGKYVQAATVREDLLRIGAAIKGGILRMESELPPILDGQTPAQMQKTIRAYLDGILSQFSNLTAELYKEQNQ